jgi:hypothetical protein
MCIDSTYKSSIWASADGKDYDLKYVYYSKSAHVSNVSLPREHGLYSAFAIHWESGRFIIGHKTLNNSRRSPGRTPGAPCGR